MVQTKVPGITTNRLSSYRKWSEAFRFKNAGSDVLERLVILGAALVRPLRGVWVLDHLQRVPMVQRILYAYR